MALRGKLELTDQQAAEWLARLRADDRADADDAAFRAWLNDHQDHRAAFTRASAIWASAGAIDRDAIAATVPTAAATRVTRRTVIAGGASMLVGGGAMIGWQAAYAGVYSTSVGEQRRLVLDDGTRALLDTDTSIRVRIDGSRRRLALNGGRINLIIAPSSIPFLVDAGSCRAVANAARLDVQRFPDRTALTALDGRARVETGNDGEGRMLAAGQRLAQTRDGTSRVDQPAIEDISAWQQGRLAFRDETLANAVAEMNRYSERQLILADADVGALRVSGIYRVGDPGGFARSLGLLLPVRPVADGRDIRIESAR